MPLQNRVTPEGQIIATPARGTMMGNRGGAIHTPERTLGPRRWRTRAWICCVLEFKGRRRAVMSPRRYTELFFLDEATALAAGHRPCFECRRQDALRFAEAWRRAHDLPGRPKAADMDAVLHRQRTRGSQPGDVREGIDGLPDGTIVRWRHAAYLVLDAGLLGWTLEGYTPAVVPPPDAAIEVITPPATVAVLTAGYRPLLHPTAHAAPEHGAVSTTEGGLA